MVSALQSLPAKLEQTLAMAESIEALAEDFADKHHSLFLGRGEQSAIAMEGALKLKKSPIFMLRLMPLVSLSTDR